jgi:small subunit ribosomal protein S19e
LETPGKEVISVPAGKLVELVGKEIASMSAIKAPAWIMQVKSGSHAERTISDPNFWQNRLGSILVAVWREPIGVSRLRRKYGGKREHTVSRSHHRMAGGKIIRTGLQQLEAAGLVKKEKKGRVITPAGMSVLAKAAAKNA